MSEPIPAHGVRIQIAQSDYPELFDEFATIVPINPFDVFYEAEPIMVTGYWERPEDETPALSYELLVTRLPRRPKRIAKKLARGGRLGRRERARGFRFPSRCVREIPLQVGT